MYLHVWIGEHYKSTTLRPYILRVYRVTFPCQQIMRPEHPESII
jgi:hypothetical protein